MPAASIDEVIERLDAIVERARGRPDRFGLFPALYRRTTVRVRQGILEGRFEDGGRMERLDVVFANRFLAAYDAHLRGGAPPQAWRYAFARAEEPEHLVLQHLMLGMNAHINLDLGIAASVTCPGAAVHGLERDFFEINVILADMVDAVQADLNALSPLLGWIDRFGGRGDEALVRAFLLRSRRAAWRKAVRLATLAGQDRRDAIASFDRFATRLARRLCPVPSAQMAWLRRVRSQEVDDLVRVYQAVA